MTTDSVDQNFVSPPTPRVSHTPAKVKGSWGVFNIPTTAAHEFSGHGCRHFQIFRRPGQAGRLWRNGTHGSVGVNKRRPANRRRQASARVRKYGVRASATQSEPRLANRSPDGLSMVRIEGGRNVHLTTWTAATPFSHGVTARRPLDLNYGAAVQAVPTLRLSSRFFRLTSGMPRRSFRGDRCGAA